VHLLEHAEELVLDGGRSHAKYARKIISLVDAAEQVVHNFSLRRGELVPLSEKVKLVF